MPKHRVTAPRDAWPEVLRVRFDALALSEHQRHRLGHALGRWVLLAPDPIDVTRETCEAVIAPIQRTQRGVAASLRQVLGLVFPEAAPMLYSLREPRRRNPRDPRVDFAEHLKRHLARCPQEWQERAAPMVIVDPDGLGDGLLVEAWAASTLKRCVEAAGRYFDCCRVSGLPCVLHSSGVKARLREMQKDGRRPTAACIEIASLLALSRALHPEIDHGWLEDTHRKLKKISAASPSRNAGRALPADDLRQFGLEVFELADRKFDKARLRRDFEEAHMLARTALALVLLTEAPMRVGALASVDVTPGLLSRLVMIHVEGCDTKTGEAETRLFSSEAVRCLSSYISRHRAAMALPSENKLFVGDNGLAVLGATLSENIGRLTEDRLDRRVTAHPIRHSAANYIVARAPEEAALASVILGHRTRGVTPVYTRRAGQVLASKTHAETARRTAERLGADTEVFRRKTAKTPRRTRQDRPLGKKGQNAAEELPR